MARRRNDEDGKTEELSKRQERAQRILDAAEELTLRWGYSKTTIDDIARQARVAKGTIYLHWKTREELFMAMISRAQVKLLKDLEEMVASDPEGATLHGLTKNSVLATLKNPLLKAVILRDVDILGELVHTEYGKKLTEERYTSFTTYLSFLREQGLIRTDISMDEQIYLLSTLVTGYLLADSFVPEQFKQSDERAVELLAETIRRTFEPPKVQLSEDMQNSAEVFHHYFNGVVDMIKQHDQEEQTL